MTDDGVGEHPLQVALQKRHRPAEQRGRDSEPEKRVSDGALARSELAGVDGPEHPRDAE